jgi:hypothetical protein
MLITSLKISILKKKTNMFIIVSNYTTYVHKVFNPAILKKNVS